MPNFSIGIRSIATVSRPARGMRYNAWPSILALPDGDLLCCWSGPRRMHVCPFGKVSASRSRDGGRTWSAPYTVLDTPLDDRDAGLCLDADGCVLLTSFTNSVATQRHYQDAWCYLPSERDRQNKYLNTISRHDEQRFLGSLLARSDDGGKTFGPPALLPITAPHGPILLPDGNLLYVGRAFSDSTPAAFPYLSEGIWAIGPTRDLMRSAPRLVVPASALADTLLCEPHACALPNGEILLGIRLESPKRGIFETVQCVSKDGGRTFSEPVPSNAEGSPPHYCLDARRGLVAESVARRKPPFGILLRISDDCGSTWSEPILLQICENGDIGYPCTALNADGSFATVWYESIGGAGTDVRCAVWTL